MNKYIKLEYYGSIRLLLSKKEESIEVQEDISFDKLIKIINEMYTIDFTKKSINLAFNYYPNQDDKSYGLNYPKDKDSIIKNKSTVKVFNKLTLG